MSSTTINNPEPSANALSHQKVSRLTSTALFAALICVTTAYIFHIPFGVNGGYIHIGDSLIYLAAAFLPTPYAMFAGAIGGAMADILTAPVYAPATFIIKMLISLPITCKKDKIVNVHNCVGVVVAAVISFIGYYIRCNPVRNLGCTDSFDCRNPCPIRRKCCDLYHSWFHS